MLLRVGELEFLGNRGPVRSQQADELLMTCERVTNGMVNRILG